MLAVTGTVMNANYSSHHSDCIIQIIFLIHVAECFYHRFPKVENILSLYILLSQYILNGIDCMAIRIVQQPYSPMQSNTKVLS